MNLTGGRFGAVNSAHGKYVIRPGYGLAEYSHLFRNHAQPSVAHGKSFRSQSHLALSVCDIKIDEARWPLFEALAFPIYPPLARAIGAFDGRAVVPVQLAVVIQGNLMVAPRAH